MNLVEIAVNFKTDLDIIKHAEGIRWEGNITCPKCQSNKVSNRHEDHRRKCKTCQKSFSVTTGTYLHNARIPLRTWYMAIALITDAKKGISAKQIQRNLGVNYKTAYRMGMIMRDAMKIENSQIQLEGVVEMDETYTGGKPRKPGFFSGTKADAKALDKRVKNLEQRFELKQPLAQKKKPSFSKRGRGTKKIPVTGIVERNGNVIAKVMSKLTHKELRAMVEKYVKLDESLLITDEYRGYNKMDAIIEHVKIDHTKMYSYRGVNTNTIESFWAILKRGIIGQYHQVSPEKLPEYIEEFVFKYNNRKDNNLMFTSLLQKCLSDKKKSTAAIGMMQNDDFTFEQHYKLVHSMRLFVNDRLTNTKIYIQGKAIDRHDLAVQIGSYYIIINGTTYSINEVKAESITGRNIAVSAMAGAGIGGLLKGSYGLLAGGIAGIVFGAVTKPKNQHAIDRFNHTRTDIHQ